LGIPAHQQQLIFGATKINDSQSLREAGLFMGCTVHVLIKQEAEVFNDSIRSRAFQQYKHVLVQCLYNDVRITARRSHHIDWRTSNRICCHKALLVDSSN
jgi:hypothetical protein